MSLVIYDGKGKLFYYLNHIRSNGGVPQQTVYHYPLEQVTLAWLGNASVRHIVRKFLNKLFTDLQFQQKEFPILS